MSQEDLGAKLALELRSERGFSKANISHWETMKHGPSLEQLLAVSKVTGCALPEVLTGMSNATQPSGGGRLIAVDAYNHNDNPNVVQVPRVELRVSAGITGFAVDGSDDMDLETYPLDRRWVERKGYAVNKLLAMYVKGDSMYPTYKEGDIIVINTADTKMEDTKEYVFNFDGDVVLKTLTRERGTWWLTSVNDEPKYHQRSVRSGETFIIGRVVKHDRVNL